MAMLNLGLKFVPSVKCKPAGQLDEELRVFTRNVRLRAQFGDKKQVTKNMEFYVANPGFNPDQGSPVVENLLADIKDTVQKCFSYEQTTTRHLPGNMSYAQKKALQQLRQDKDIVIKPADKNMGLCIVDKAWYVQECERHVLDTATYRCVDIPQEQILKC